MLPLVASILYYYLMMELCMAVGQTRQVSLDLAVMSQTFLSRQRYQGCLEEYPAYLLDILTRYLVLQGIGCITQVQTSLDNFVLIPMAILLQPPLSLHYQMFLFLFRLLDNLPTS